MRSLVALASIPAFFVWGSATAAYVCTGTESPGTVTFAPPNPTSTQVVHGLWNAGKFQITGLQVAVTATAINIGQFGFPPPVAAYIEFCEEFDVGPLPAGSYAVNLQTGGLTPGTPLGTPVQIGTLVVAAAAPLSPSAAIPTTDRGVLAVLAILLALVALPFLRRARPRPPIGRR